MGTSITQPYYKVITEKISRLKDLKNTIFKERIFMFHNFKDKLIKEI